MKKNVKIAKKLAKKLEAWVKSHKEYRIRPFFFEDDYWDYYEHYTGWVNNNNYSIVIRAVRDEVEVDIGLNSEIKLDQNVEQFLNFINTNQP